jgi:hypothetical protein
MRCSVWLFYQAKLLKEQAFNVHGLRRYRTSQVNTQGGSGLCQTFQGKRLPNH